MKDRRGSQEPAAWFGTHEYMDYVRELETEPYINVNFGTGTAAEAAR